MTNITRRFVLGLAALVLLPGLAMAQTRRAAKPNAAAPDAVDRYILGEMQAQRIPGMAVAIVRDGKIAKMKGYGLANVELRVPVTPDTVFQTGSLGKQFTAALVMSLVEQGTVELDAPIAKYLGDVPDSWKPITVRHLLTHTSGIANFPYGSGFDLRRNYTEDELLTLAKTPPLDFLPGTDWAYSNTGYVVLGILVHKAAGTFYGDLLQERFFKPLGMTGTRIITEEDIVVGRADGYRHQGGKLKNQQWVAPRLNTTADGGLYTTLRDMARWEQALGEARVLKPDSLRQMWTAATVPGGDPTEYGFGWMVNRVNGRRRIEHNGEWQGFTTAMARHPDDKLTVIVLTNLAGIEPLALAHRVAGLTVPGLATNDAKPIPASPEVTKLLKEALDEAATGKITESRYTPAMFEALTPENVKRGVLLFETLGPVKKLALLKAGTSGDLRLYRYRASFAKEKLAVELALDKDNKIAGMRLVPE